MTKAMPTISRTTSRLEIACWSLAFLVVSAACAAGSNYMMQASATAGDSPAPEPAIMIELALEPEAEAVDKTEIAEDSVNAEATPALQPVKEVAEPTPDPVPPALQPVVEKPETSPPVAEIKPPEPQEMPELAAIAPVEVPLPMVRPEPAPPKKKVVRTAQPRPPSVAARKAEVQARKSNRTAARETTASIPAPSRSEIQTWKARVAARLESAKRYPASARARNERGTALVSFRIDGGGAVVSSSLVRSSGSVELDRATLNMVASASPLPAPPPGVSRSITVPVQFR